MKTNEILLGNCLELFKTIPDNSVDVSFADPPFNLHKKYKTYKDNMTDEEYVDWCWWWLGEMWRVTKPSGSIFVHNIPKWLTHYATFLNEHAIFKHWISWDAPGSPMGTSLQPAHYGILYYTKSADAKFYEIRQPNRRCRTCDRLLKDYGGKKDTIPFFGPLLSDVWTDIHRCKHDKYRDKHPCQLPIHLLERIILMASDEGDIVLDPFMGTGTTAIAAKRLGRRYIGFELSEEYKAIAERKLEQETRPSKIGNFWVSCYLKNIATVRDMDVKNEEFMSFYDWPVSAPAEAVNWYPVQFKEEIATQIKAICAGPVEAQAET